MALLFRLLRANFTVSFDFEDYIDELTARQEAEREAEELDFEIENKIENYEENKTYKR
jgi:hypothetical protein